LKAGLRRGLFRSGAVISFSLALYVVLSTTGGAMLRFLRWFDFLAPVPGLSGIAILAVSPVIFLLFVFVAHWVFTGFAGRSEDRRDANSR